MARRLAAPLAIVLFAATAAWALFSGLPRWYAARGTPPTPSATPSTPAAAETPAKITATLYYVSDDGTELVGMQREVPLGGAVADQARRIVEAQLTPAPPLVSAVPDGTTLRALFLTDRGEAFVDLSGDVRAKHPGGSLDELFTVYTIVNALTVNLPAIQRVQILIDGKEVDTLAGHVDLRHPLQRSLKLVRTDKE